MTRLPSSVGILPAFVLAGFTVATAHATGDADAAVPPPPGRTP